MTSSLHHLDTSSWEQIALHLGAHDLLRLVLTGNHAIASKIHKGARHFAFDNSCTEEVSYPDLLRVFSLSERLCSSVTSFEFKSRCDAELVWSCNWALPRPSYSNLRHLSLNFFGSVAAVFSQKEFAKVYPHLESLILVDKLQYDQQWLNCFKPLKFSALPPTLRVIRISSPQFISLDPKEMDFLPPVLETLHLNAKMTFDPQPDEYIKLCVPTTLTDLLITTDDVLLWIIDFSSLPSKMQRFELIGEAAADEQRAGATLVLLDGIENFSSLDTLIMEECTVHAHQLDKVPRCVNYLKCDVLDELPSDSAATSSLSGLKALKNFSVRDRKSPIARRVLDESEDVCVVEYLESLRFFLPLLKYKLPSSITSFKALNVHQFVLPPSLTSLECNSLELGAAQIATSLTPSGASASTVLGTSLPSKLAKLIVREEVPEETIALLPPSLTFLETRMSTSTWISLSKSYENGHLPLLRTLKVAGGIPWHLLGRAPASIETFSFVAGRYPVAASELRDLSMVANLRCLRTLTVIKDPIFVGKTFDCGEIEVASYRLLFASLPPTITSLEMEASSEFLPDIRWPSSLRYLKIRFHSSSRGNVDSYMTEGGPLPLTLSTLPKELISLRIAMNLSGAGPNLTARPEFPQHLSCLDEFGSSSRYFRLRAKGSPHTRLEDDGIESIEKAFFAFPPLD